MPLAPKSFQDIVTFSRASTGTYYNSSGYLTTAGILNYLTYSNTPENAAWNKQDSFVQTNLLTYSEQFNNAVWVKAGVTVTGNSSGTLAPNGTQTADLVVVNNGAQVSVQTYQDLTALNASTSYTMSAYVKKAGAQYAVVGWLYTAGVYAAVSYDLDTQTVSRNFAGGGFTITGTTITSVGSGWYRITVTATTPSTAAFSRYPMVIPRVTAWTSGNPDGPDTGDGTSGIYVWGAQLVQGAVPGDYQATTAAALPILYADWTGALTARKICQNAAAATPHGLRQSPANLTGSTTYTMSFYAKAGESTKANAWQFATSVFTTTAAAVYDLVAGTATGDGSPTIQSVGNGWYRCTKTLTTVASPASGTIHIGPTDAAGNQNYNGDGTSGVYITDMQIEVGTTVGPYYETTASQYNAPRFDYDPATLQLRGLLVEEQRANLLLQSNDFQTSWSPTNITRTLNSILSPSGNVDGVKIEATAAVGTVLYQGAVVAATAVTGSVYVKQGTSATIGNTFGLRNQTTATDLVFATVNYSTGAIAYVVGSSGVTATNVGNGWWRITITATSGITSGDNIRFYVGFSGIAATAGDFLYAYGAQLETVAFATSYIPTVASQVTRAVDSVFLNTLSPWFNQRTGTLYISGSYYSAITAAGTRGGFVGSGPYASANSINIFNSGGATTLDTYFTSITYPDVNLFRPLTTTANAVNRIAYGYNQNNGIYGLSVNASAVTTATSTQNTATFTSIALGRRDASTSNLLNGHIQRFTYYPRRLTDAELQAITT